MARYTGPRAKISRRFGVSLFGPSKSLERRNFPPGQHGVRAGRKKKSEYAVALGEKQKLRFQYGVLEKQFRGYYEEAARRRGITGVILLQLLECRLDNVCYRAGFGNTRQSARQLVNHGHVLVNGKRVNIPSYQVREGDTIEIAERSRNHPHMLESVQHPERDVPEYITFDSKGLKAQFVRVPKLSDVPYPVQMEPNLVIEYYSR